MRPVFINMSDFKYADIKVGFKLPKLYFSNRYSRTITPSICTVSMPITNIGGIDASHVHNNCSNIIACYIMTLVEHRLYRDIPSRASLALTRICAKRHFSRTSLIKNFNIQDSYTIVAIFCFDDSCYAYSEILDRVDNGAITSF